MTNTRAAVLDGPELRDLGMAAARAQIRTVGDAQRFDGHAAVFDARTAIGNPLRWGFYEEVARGAFTKTIPEGDARFLIDHDSYYIVSRRSAGGLVLAEDAIGLHVDSELDEELSYVKDLKVNLTKRNITGMSFGFYVVKDDWQTEKVETKDGDNFVEVEVRIIQEVRLIEVSAVTFPAYEQTDAGLRSVAAALRARGDGEVIQQRLALNPDLAQYLGERKVSVQVPSTLDFPAVEPPTGKLDPRDKADVPSEEHSEEPAETTPAEDDGESRSEPAETTPDTPLAPSEDDIRAAQARYWRTKRMVA